MHLNVGLLPGYRVTAMIDRDVYVVERLRDGRRVEVTSLDLMQADKGAIEDAMRALVKRRFAEESPLFTPQSPLLVLTDEQIDAAYLQVLGHRVVGNEAAVVRRVVRAALAMARPLPPCPPPS